jgi:PAS domain S-box-containing protein
MYEFVHVLVCVALAVVATTGYTKTDGAWYLHVLVCIALAVVSWEGLGWRRRKAEAEVHAQAHRRAARRLGDIESVLETLAEPVIVMRNGIILSVNNATLVIFGYGSKADLIGNKVTVLMQQEQADAHSSYVERFESTGEKRVIGLPREVTGRHRDGSNIPLTLSVSMCANPGEYIGIASRLWLGVP